MKIKKSLIILGTLLSTALAGCGSQVSFTEQPLVQVQGDISTNDDITLKSSEGLFEFITVTQRALFKAYDKNKDSFITKAEISGFVLDEFDNVDLDHNGKITFKESSKSWLFFNRQINGGLFQSMMNQLFIDYLDKDNNMLLSRDEFLGFYLKNTTDPARIRYFKTSFTKNDINKDGSLNFSEYEDAMYTMFKSDIKVEIRDNGYAISFGKY
jgi:hypothetical protein